MTDTPTPASDSVAIPAGTKTCPVCGEQPKWRGSASDYIRGLYRLQCIGETHLFQAYGASEQKCVEHWNTRTPKASTIDADRERIIGIAVATLRDTAGRPFLCDRRIWEALADALLASTNASRGGEAGELLARCAEELRLIRMKDTGAVYDIGLRTDLSAYLSQPNASNGVSEGWRTIESAPAATGSDDERVLVWGPKMASVEVVLPDGDWWRKRAAESGGGGFITHWMPQPTPPSTDQKAGR